MKNKVIELQDIQNRSVLADQVLNNTVYQQAMLAMECDLMQSFQNTKHDDQAMRDEIWRQMQTVKAHKAKLAKVMKTGKIQETNSKSKSFF